MSVSLIPTSSSIAGSKGLGLQAIYQYYQKYPSRSSQRRASRLPPT